MTVGLSNVLVVTGGTSGIGASLVAEAAARGSFDIYYAGSRAFEAVPENLRSLDATYAQVDVENAEQVRAFRDLVVSKASPEARWLVVASAGISERKDPAKIQRMFGINVGGTQNLLNAFEERLRHDPENLFVGVGSIVAAEGAAVKGDEEYQETKKEVHRISTEIARKRGVNGLTLVPGLIDTPMTRKEIVIPMILLGAVKAAGQDEAHPLRAEILAASGLAAWSSNADVLRAVLGSSLSAIKDAAKVEDGFKKDSELKRAGSVFFMTRAAVDRGVVDQAAQILTSLDIAISPDTVAGSLLNTFESGAVLEDGMLKVYSRKGQNHILSLLGAMG